MGKRRQSLQKKLALVFVVIIICIMLIALMLYSRTVNVIRRETYEKMESQAEYYQELLETEIQYSLDLQLGFFANRKLVFLGRPNSGLDAYEERDSVLDVQERIWIIAQSSRLLQDGVLYIPHTNYYISSSDIRRMTAQDLKEMENYLANSGTDLQYDGENFYSVRTGETGSTVSKDPNFVFVITFSSKQIEENLSLFNTASKGGAFLYDEQEDILLESSGGCPARDIWMQLSRQEDGSFQSVQRARVNGDDYLVLVGSQGPMGVFVQYVEEAPLMAEVNRFWGDTLFFLLVMIVLSVLFILYTRRLVHRPIQKLVEAFGRLEEGNLSEHIYHKNNDEFAYIYQSFNDMEDRLSKLIDEVYVQKNLVQKAQLKQLQAQINPHFLYNSFFLLSRRIKRGDDGGAQELAGHLGDYFKYLARNSSDYVPLSQETEHARSYAAIQQARFVSRVSVEFGLLPENWRNVLVPRLIIQPLLENAFGHGLENKVSDGILRVAFAEEETELYITVEDNGEECGDEVIADMRSSLEPESGREITGTVNIHRRLQMYFQGKGGLAISRSQLGGLAVTIHIPGETERTQEVFA